ncbi:MAG: chemotaxis protein CheA [Deltaproteobacteria bacterium]|nr:chemotaxis protein CheA [Deltaproteobacteria bacterium]
MDLDLSQARLTFIAESSELLQEMENSLLQLESLPENQELINSLFRSAHTIKGSSGVLGIETVEKFTHFVENLLSKMRENEIKVISEIIELLLECRDHTSALIELAAAEIYFLDDRTAERERELIERLNSYLACTQREDNSEEPSDIEDTESGKRARTDAWHISIRFGINTLKDGMDPISFINYLLKMGELVHITTLYNSMPPVAEFDPEACYLGFEIDLKTDFEKKAIEDVFEFVREDSSIHILPPYSKVESYVELLHNLPEDTSLLGEILVKGGVLTQTELEEALRHQNSGSKDDNSKTLIGEILVNEGMVYPELIEAALDKQKQVLGAKAKEATTIRIDANKLDQLVNLVGELVISSANMDQQAQRLCDGQLIESASIMLRLVEEIRENTMKLRMVPIGDTFSRFNRVIRDISRDTGKDIELVISGGETELDKTVIEKVNDPLMHIVRNAADHGIELPEIRNEINKSAKGKIRLNAYHDAGSIVIEVSDDGRGLNRDKIYRKGVAVGLINQGAQLSDKELFRLIFEPGFSTADQITKLSGRGVGMDVVKKNIEALRGTVEVESIEGKGATVRIRLPLTMAIIDGFMVGVGESQYVIPLDMVMECVELTEADKQASKKRNYINLRGEVLPYIRLRDYFGEHGNLPRFENIIIVQYAGQKIGFVVDELFGEVQTVIKSLGKVYRDVKGISGATIMGNGKVALILDIPRLMQSAENIIDKIAC